MLLCVKHLLSQPTLAICEHAPPAGASCQPCPTRDRVSHVQLQRRRTSNSSACRASFSGERTALAPPPLPFLLHLGQTLSLLVAAPYPGTCESRCPRAERLAALVLAYLPPCVAAVESPPLQQNLQPPSVPPRQRCPRHLLLERRGPASRAPPPARMPSAVGPPWGHRAHGAALLRAHHPRHHQKTQSLGAKTTIGRGA